MLPRVLFMGTPAFAVAAFRALALSPQWTLIGAVSQPDKPQGRGRGVVATPVKKAATEIGCPVFQPVRIKNPDAQELLSALRPDLIFVVAYGQILPKWLLDLPPLGAVNLHASLLPRYRGAAPLQRAILNGESHTGFSLMLMDEGMDTGPILSQTEFEIQDDENSGELASRAGLLGAEFSLRELPRLISGDLTPHAQDGTLATYAPVIKKEEGRLDFEQPAASLHNRVRAFNPWPIARCSLGGETLNIHRTQLVSSGELGTPGELIDVGQGRMVIQCSPGLLGMLLVQLAGRKIVTGQDFANGMRLKPGFRFENG